MKANTTAAMMSNAAAAEMIPAIIGTEASGGGSVKLPTSGKVGEGEVREREVGERDGDGEGEGLEDAPIVEERA